MSNQTQRPSTLPMRRFRGNRPPIGSEKPKNFSKTWMRLLRYNSRYIVAILIVLVLAVLAATFQIVGPNQLKVMVDEIAKGLPAMVDGQPVSQSIDFKIITDIGLLLAVLYTASGLLSFSENFIMATVTAKISRRMRSDISKKINRLPLRYFDQTSHGDVLSLITNDVDVIGQTLNQSLDNFVRAITMLVGTLALMLFNSRILTAVTVISVSVGFILMQIIMKNSQKYFSGQQEGLGEINGHIEEIYSGHNIVKAYNGGQDAKETFEKINQKVCESAWKSQFMSGLMRPIMEFSGNFGYLAVCVVGAILAINGSISFGVIVAFMMYVRYFTQPLSQLAQSLQAMQRTAAASERVFEFFDQTEMDDEDHKTQKLSNVKGDVAFKKVHFGYEKDKPIIRDFSVDIKAGQKVAIVGPTGAGKTTIVNLLMRFYEIDSGEITIDQIPIHQVPRENVHEQFGMVLQDTWIFEGTIKDNIIYSKKGVTDSEVQAACQAAGLDHFVHTLPQGYDTVLDDKMILSAGQKQLLTIARAMIQDAPMLILDEATSSVDTRTERHVQAAMDRLTQGRTSFVIAHRLSTIVNSDIILVLEDGDIVESGNHSTLLRQNGPYANMYKSQWEN
ncbi:MAG: ABC transporter ATP-binding protein [Eubacteriaceae bacterium]|jgi:ATP-binding cassette subfamily B protein|nr:ABC transporter ATP-binding protein [Eubacteriaceae bacterium]